LVISSGIQYQSNIIIIAWNGIDEPLKHIAFDAVPAFSIILFNYSGNGAISQLPDGKYISECISVKTEFKGVLMLEVCNFVKDIDYTYIGLLDDDQSISVLSLNKLLDIATKYKLDVFQPAVSSDSYYSHAMFLQKNGHLQESVYWVEIMSPFLRKEIFESGESFYRSNISSYGVDRYLFPYLQKKLNRCKTALVHEVCVRHLKPVTDGKKKFSNGLDARQEGELIRKKILALIQSDGLDFSEKALREVYEVGQIRWQKWKYDLKRYLGI
jgi:hypothetical protein